MGERVLDYPVALRLAGVPVLLVGAGLVAAKRLDGLLEVGATVRVVAPQVHPTILERRDDERLSVVIREFEPSDLNEMRIVFAATNDAVVNRAVYNAAHQRGLLVNIADVPDLCDFALPSVGRRGPLTVAVSTSGHAPGIARLLRQSLMAHVGSEYAVLARIIGRLRHLVPSGPSRMAWFERITTHEAAQLLAKGERRAVFNRLREGRGA